MKRMILVALMLAFSAGCASKDYVRQQIEPLQDKVNKALACCEQNQKAIKKSFQLQQKK
jgi:type IV pilus biogenesis protein CpaD/CtpE